MTLSHRAGNLRARSHKCKFCQKRYRIPGWCQWLQIGALFLYTIIFYNFKFFFFFGEKPALIINALIALGILYVVGIMLSFVALLVKDEFTGTASKDQYY